MICRQRRQLTSANTKYILTLTAIGGDVHIYTIKDDQSVYGLGGERGAVRRETV